MSGIVEQAQVARRLPAPPMRKAIRESANVSKGAMARELGVSNSAVAFWESGIHDPSPRHAARYLALLDGLRAAVQS